MNLCCKWKPEIGDDFYVVSKMSKTGKDDGSAKWGGNQRHACMGRDKNGYTDLAKSLYYGHLADGNYFQTLELAKKEADKRNGNAPKKCECCCCCKS